MCLLLFFSCCSYAQINKETWLIGGNAAFNLTQSEELKLTTVQLSPGGGYFFTNRIAAGLRTNITLDRYSWPDEKWRWLTVSLAPFARYYFLPAEQKVNLFADASYGFARSWYKSISYGGKYAYNTSTISAMAGPAIFLNKHTSVEMTVGYSYLSRGPIDSSAAHQFRFGVGLQVHLGK